MRKGLIALLLLVPSLHPAHTPSIILGTLTAPGVTSAVDLYNSYKTTPHKHTIEVNAQGTPATCTIELDGTLDAPASATAAWSNLSGSQSCSGTGLMFHIADKPIRAIRGNLTALSGGSVTVVYLGVE